MSAASVSAPSKGEAKAKAKSSEEQIGPYAENRKDGRRHAPLDHQLRQCFTCDTKAHWRRMQAIQVTKFVGEEAYNRWGTFQEKDDLVKKSNTELH